MSEEENSTNVNDIIHQDNFDERDIKSKEPTALHPVVAERLNKEKSGFSDETTRINEKVPEEENSEDVGSYVTRSELEALEKRISNTVNDINGEFKRIGDILQDLANAVNTISANDKTYKNSFIGLENRLSKILRQMGNIGS